MDMYRILENFDAVNRKENLSEGLAGAALGGLAGAALTKSPGGAMSGANIGSAIQDNLGEEQLDEGPYTRLNTYRVNGQDMIEYLANETGAQVEMRGDDVGILVVDIISFPKLAKLAADLAQQGKITAIGGPATKDMTGKAVRAGVKYPMSGVDEELDEELDEERRSEADWDAAAMSAGKRGRDARDNPSRHAARAKAGQAMRGNAKPDFLDLDRDGDKTEPMKSAAKGVAEGMLTHRDFEKPDDVDVQKMAKMAAKGLLTYATKTKMNPANLLKKDYYALAAMLEKVNPNLYAAIDDQLSDNDYNWLYFKAADLAANAAAKQGIAEAGKAPFPGTPEYELRFGKDDASSAFDKKKISTGTVYSRKHFDEPETDDDTPKSAGRPKGTGRKLGAKGPSVASKLLKGKGGLKEHDHEHGMDMHMHNDLDSGEYDQEGDMAQQDLHTVVDAARELHSILASDENLPEWVQAKITKALDYIDTARDYVKSSHAERGQEVEIEMDEAYPPVVMPPDQKYQQALARVYGQQILKNPKFPDLMARLKRATPNERDLDVIIKTGTLPNHLEEVGYSAKSARAGKDIGKPGKNFAKIAKGAAERYGSKAAGERVAGAVLNKLRAKEGVEEESADKKDPPFTPDTKSSFKKSNNPNRTNRDSVKALAQKGLADMTTAELKAELKRRSQVEEESTETRDQHAEKAGKKVTKDIEHDEGHKGRDDAKAEKAGKKVAKDIEYDDKKDKEEKVDETTVSGSVATSAGGDAPKKGKGGMQFGQGVYEGQVAESFEKKLKNVLNEGMSVNVSTDDTGKKSISVNATDADADALGDMLKMAGLFSSEGYSSVCQDCGGIHEAGACGADMVEEELANSPDEVYTDADYMTQTLSGGLNGPKTTGQTTIPVINRQDSRQGVMAEAGTVIPLGPDSNIELRRAAEQGHRDAMRGIDNNPYFKDNPAGRAYRQGQESFKQETGTNTMPTPADLARRRGDVKEVAERVKTQAESRLWNLYKKI